MNQSLDFPLGPFYAAACIVAGVLATVVRETHGRRTWLSWLLSAFACGLALRLGMLVVEGLQ